MKMGTKVTFKDKTGEQLIGKINCLEFMGDKKIIGVTCFKKSWDMEISCLVPREICQVVEE